MLVPTKIDNLWNWMQCNCAESCQVWHQRTFTRYSDVMTLPYFFVSFVEVSWLLSVDGTFSRVVFIWFNLHLVACRGPKGAQCQVWSCPDKRLRSTSRDQAMSCSEWVWVPKLGFPLHPHWCLDCCGHFDLPLQYSEWQRPPDLKQSCIVGGPLATPLTPLSVFSSRDCKVLHFLCLHLKIYMRLHYRPST